MWTPLSALAFAMLVPGDPDPLRGSVEKGLYASVRVEGATWTIEERMAWHHVPGCSVAVIVDGKVSWAAGYGVRDAGHGGSVGTETLFQAASISKAIAAMAAMDLVEDGRLALDAALADDLERWRPAVLADAQEPALTLEHLLSHTGGTTVHGFPGYGRFDPLPTLEQVLSGTGHANTPAVAVDTAPGTITRYSGGGSTIAQLAMIEATGQSFDELLQERVLTPLGMENSTYAQPLDVEQHPEHSSGHGADGRRVIGGWHTYPEQFAAGLWTTPTDLARALGATRAALRGEGPHPLTRATLEDMLSPRGDGSFGLGFQRIDLGGEAYFGHDGSNEGFFCTARIHRESGLGAVIMTNGVGGMPLMQEILNSIQYAYAWPGIETRTAQAIPVGPAQLDRYAGRFLYDGDDVLLLEAEGQGLRARRLPRRGTTWVPVGVDRFLECDTNQTWIFSDNANVVSRGERRTARQAVRMASTEEPGPEELLFTERTEEALLLLEAQRAADPSANQFSERELARQISRLVYAGLPSEAEHLAQWAFQVHPRSPIVLSAYAHSRELVGSRSEALELYTLLRSLGSEEIGSSSEQREADAWVHDYESAPSSR